jgi:teichuronic acid exporter
MKSKVMHSIKWMTFARLAAQLLRWTATLIVIRILSPADFSIVALAETVLGFLEIFATLGLSAAIIRSQDASKELLRSLFTLIATMNSILGLILFSSASAVADFYHQPELVMVMRVLSLGFVMSAFEIIPATLLAKEMRFKEVAIIQLAAGAAGAVISLVMAQLGFGYWTLVAGGLGTQATRMIGALIVQPTIPLPSFDLRRAWSAASFGGFVLGSNMVAYMYITLDLVIAGRFWSAEVLGVYAVALQLATMPLNKIMPTMKQVALPAYSKAQADRSASRHYLLKSLRLSMGIGLPLFFGLASVATLLIPLVLDTKWMAASTPVMLLFLAMPFRMFMELHEPAVVAAGKPQLIFKNTIMIICVMAPAFFAASFFDPTALALTWLTLFPLLVLVACRRYHRFLGVDSAAVLKQSLPAFFVSVTMFACVKAFIFYTQTIMHSWVSLTAGIALGVLVFMAGIALLDRAMFAEYINLVKARKVALPPESPE